MGFRSSLGLGSGVEVGVRDMVEGELRVGWAAWAKVEAQRRSAVRKRQSLRNKESLAMNGVRFRKFKVGFGPDTNGGLGME